MNSNGTRVDLRCDSSREIGIGHRARCYVLAQELIIRGVAVDFVGSIGDVPLPNKLAGKVGIKRESEINWKDYSIVVLNSDTLIPQYVCFVKSLGHKIALVVDDATPALQADLYIEPYVNLLCSPPTGYEQTLLLRSPNYVLIRKEILQVKNEKPSTPISDEAKVLVLLGGSGVSPFQMEVLSGLDSFKIPLRVTLVSTLLVKDLAPFVHIKIEICPSRPDLENLLNSVDLVISAAGLTSWEVLSTCTPLAVIAVVANQEPNYASMVETNCPASLGRVHQGEAFDLGQMHKFVLSNLNNERTTEQTSKLVDGERARRVADALDGLIK